MTRINEMKPEEAWAFMQREPKAILVDVRTSLEFSHVGHPVGALHIPWKEAPLWTVNPRFVFEVQQRIPNRETPILLLCRSGQRSLDAARALEAAGYQHLTNILEGFEGPLDRNKHRNTLGGWRYHGLPWEQS